MKLADGLCEAVSSECISVGPFLAATLSTQIVVAWALSLMAAIAPKVATEIGISAVAVGYQVSLAYCGAMMSSLLGGTFVRRWGAVRTSQVCLLVSMLGCLLLTIPNLLVLAIGSVVIGLSYGLANPAASHLLARFSGSSFFNLIFSMKQTGIPLGAMLAGLVAPYLAVSFGWRWVFVVVGVTALILALALQPPRQRWDADRNPAVTESPLGGLRLVWAMPILRWLSLGALCFAAIQLCVGSFLVTFLVEEVGFNLVRAGMMLSLVQISGVFGRLAWGWIADRHHNGLAVLALVAGLMALGSFLIGTLSAWSPPALIYLVLAFLGFCAIGWPGVYLAEAVRQSPPRQSGTATGGSLFFTYAGVVIGPPMFARAYNVLGTYAATYQVLTLAAAGGLLCVGLALRSRGRRRFEGSYP